MVNRPSVPEIITVNSEELQTQIRDLLPSQNGFGSELQATNVITPIIDLTATAEGSGLPTNLQTALAYGSQTAFNISNATTDLANSPGFYRVVGTSYAEQASGGITADFIMTDGLTPKVVWGQNLSGSSSADSFACLNFDLVFWLTPGITLQGFTNGTAARLKGSIRQIADSEGTLLPPSGYPL